jgi:predicted RNase H-like nuclease (RuvC/YqgF family)
MPSKKPEPSNAVRDPRRAGSSALSKLSREVEQLKSELEEQETELHRLYSELGRVMRPLK